jgi:glycosyltransferase involved in cell wall biosynthesis
LTVTRGRILFVFPSLPAAGGAERISAALVVGLRKRGYDTAVLTLKATGELFDALRARGVPVKCAAMESRFDVRGWRRTLSVDHFRPDAVVSRSVSAHVVAALLAARLRVPHVALEHAGAGLGLRRHQRMLVRTVARSISTVVAVSDTQLPELTRLGFDRDRIRIIANGIDPSALRPRGSRDDMRAALDLDEGAFVPLLVGHLRPEKRVDLFIRAVSLARREDERIRGLVAGDGSERTRLEREAAASGGAVRLLGARDDVPDLIAAADAVCLSSSVEAMPISLLEAMAGERPVVATRTGGIADVVVPGETGLLVAVGDEAAFARALLELAAHPARALALGRAGRERILARYTIGHTLDEYDRLLAAIISSATRMSR